MFIKRLQELICTLKKKRYGIPISFIIVVVLVWAGYQIGWTDFKGKHLWDWMELLIVPIVLGAGALLFRRAEKNSESELALDRQRQEALMTYFDRMENLLLKHDLRESKDRDVVRTVARARTLLIFRNLDADRKRYALQFIVESNLDDISKPIVEIHGVDMSRANLKGVLLEGINLDYTNLKWAGLEGAYLRSASLKRANMKWANMEEIDLEGANLEQANLEEANLWLANLRKANLGEARLKGANLDHASLNWANLEGANLEEANLEGAYFRGANLYRANLDGANLKWAHLSDAKISPIQLIGVKDISNATMPNGMIYKEWVSKGKPDWTKS